MNFLFHMLLSGDDDQLLVGNFMGDFVKGPLSGRFAPRIRQGIELHRRIDSYAEQSQYFRGSRERISADYGRYRGIMVDMFYDYFLVNDWDSWSREPFEHFLQRTRSVMEYHLFMLPTTLQQFLPIIFDELLPSYGTVDGIGRALCRLSRRIGHDNPLTGAQRELVRLHKDLLADFRSFTPEIITWCGERVALLPQP